MRRPFLLLLLSSAAAALAVACGGSLAGGEIPGSTPDGGTSADGGTNPIGKRDAGRVPKKDAGSDGNTYVDPPCPNPPPPKSNFECDVATQSGCAPEEGCYPYVRYPGGYCEAEEYGSACYTAGDKKQGEVCNSVLECAGGFICVITGAGTSCAKYCELGKANACPEGLVCEPLDVSGMGVCN
jgi:hypothetical protein